MSRVGILAACAIFGAAISPEKADAAVTIQFTQNGGNVEATTSGSLNLTGLTSIGFVLPYYGVRATSGQFATGAPIPNTLLSYSGISGPAGFGSGNIQQLATSRSGDNFWLSAMSGMIGVQNTYVSGATLSATSIFANQTFASLGLTPGEYVYTSSADTITVRIGNVSGAVPEPGSWAMMLLGFGAIGFSMRRSRRMQAVLRAA